MAPRVKLNEGGGSYFGAPKTDVKCIPSGSKLLDLALGGGWARNRIANIIGDRSSGKTLLAIEACTNFARILPKANIRYRESERAFDPPYAKALGCPIDRIDFGDSLETVEDLFEDLQRIIKGAKHEELVIVDSLDALSDRAEMARDMDAGSYGAQKAKNLSQLFRRLIGGLEKSRVTLIIISQIRDAIGVVYGKKTKRSGGHALDFYASQVIYLNYLGKLVRTVRGIKRPIGVKIRAIVDKNKIGNPFREAEFRLMFGYGIDDLHACLSWLELAKSLKDLGIKDINTHMDVMTDMNDIDYHAEVERIHSMLEKRWWEVESSFMPTRKKY
jgi:recombination protein RecA